MKLSQTLVYQREVQPIGSGEPAEFYKRSRVLEELVKMLPSGKPSARATIADIFAALRVAYPSVSDEALYAQAMDRVVERVLRESQDPVSAISALGSRDHRMAVWGAMALAREAIGDDVSEDAEYAFETAKSWVEDDDEVSSIPAEFPTQKSLESFEGAQQASNNAMAALIYALIRGKSAYAVPAWSAQLSVWALEQMGADRSAAIERLRDAWSSMPIGAYMAQQAEELEPEPAPVPAPPMTKDLVLSVLLDAFPEARPKTIGLPSDAMKSIAKKLGVSQTWLCEEAMRQVATIVSREFANAKDAGKWITAKDPRLGAWLSSGFASVVLPYTGKSKTAAERVQRAADRILESDTEFRALNKHEFYSKARASLKPPSYKDKNDPKYIQASALEAFASIFVEQTDGYEYALKHVLEVLFKTKAASSRDEAATMMMPVLLERLRSFTCVFVK